MKKKTKRKVTSGSIVNRRASFDYALGDQLTVGLSLAGPEVRAARDGHVQLKGSYVSVRDHELWLTGASFSLRLNQKGGESRSVDTRARKLLASRRQIESLETSKQAGMTIVPLKLLTSGRYIKLVIALGKGKKKYDKRESLKRKQSERESSKMMKVRS